MYKSGTVLKNKETGKTAVVILMTDSHITLLQDEKEKILSLATLKRWWVRTSDTKSVPTKKPVTKKKASNTKKSLF